MCHLKLIAIVACLSLVFVESASAQPGWRYQYRCCGYATPVYVYPPPVVPPPVVVGPVYTYPAPVYLQPAVPVYGPTVYGYGAIGPWGRRGVFLGPPRGVVYLRR